MRTSKASYLGYGHNTESIPFQILANQQSFFLLASSRNAFIRTTYQRLIADLEESRNRTTSDIVVKNQMGTNVAVAQHILKWVDATSGGPDGAT